LNRLKQQTEYAANNSNTIIRQISYSYDKNSNVSSQTAGGQTISYSYDEINRINSVTDSYGKTIAYAYDKAGNRTQLTYPGNKTVNYSYDNADRLYTLTDWLNKTTTYTRNDAGQLTQVINGNGTKTQYTYETQTGRLINLTNQKANSSTISSHALSLDGAGNITQATVNLPLPPTMPSSINSMSYDTNNRILSAGGKTYGHDVSGRNIEENDSGTITNYHFDINNYITDVTQ